MLKHFLQFKDLSRDELLYLFERTRLIKSRFKQYQLYHPLVDRTLAMIFEKSSTRTRLSFEAGMHQLGGSAIYLNTRDTQLGAASGGRRGRGHFAHGRHRDDPHLRAGHHRALRRASRACR